MSLNSLKTALLLGGLSGALLLFGKLLGGNTGLSIALVMAVGMNFFSYFFSEKMALASSGAIRVSETENPHIWARIAPMTMQLCQRMGIPMPKLWVLPEASPNAFATGRNPNHASVAVSQGLLELMNDREVEAVIAHELGHIKHRDILIGSVAATIATAISYLGNMFMFSGMRHSDDDEDSGGGGLIGGILMMILAPLAASLIQMAISRTREFSADAAAAKYTGSPQGLINALAKLDTWSQRIPMEVSPAMSHMYIFPTLSRDTFARLFSTHPPTRDRIARLETYRGVDQIPV